MNSQINKIEVISAIMGSGKSTLFMKRMKDGTVNTPVLYITPYLNEVNRILENCEGFYQPVIDGTHESKVESLVTLLEEGVNIASTHMMLNGLPQEAFDALRSNDYMVVIDEAVSCINNFTIHANDYKMLIDKGLIEVDPKTRLATWNYHPNDTLTAYKTLQAAIKSGAVYFPDRAASKLGVLAYVWEFPTQIFKEANKVLVLTYLFEGSLMKPYFEANDLPYVVLDNKELGLGCEREALAMARALIEISYYGKNNSIGKSEKLVKPLNDMTLSSTWYGDCKPFNKSKDTKKNASHIRRAAVAKNMKNVLTNGWKYESKDIIWTAYKKVKSECTPRSYGDRFVAFNLRATNDYAHCKGVAYCVNPSINPEWTKHLNFRGASFDKDLWALSEMVQLLWRGCIRNGKPMKVFIPSIRMRTLLENWLNGDYLSEEMEETLLAA